MGVNVCRGDQVARRINGQVAASLTAAVYDAALERWPSSEADLQRQLAKLRSSEIEGFRRAYPGMKPPASPDDLTGPSGWSPQYFNFLSYITWKTAARAFPGENPPAF